MTRRRLHRDERGASAMEFALICPVLVLFIAGIVQLGILLMSNARLENAVSEGARLAVIHPRPSDQAIADRVRTAARSLDARRLSAPRVVHGTADGAEYVEISMTYNAPLNFIFLELEPVALRETRRAFIYPVS